MTTTKQTAAALTEAATLAARAQAEAERIAQALQSATEAAALVPVEDLEPLRQAVEDASAAHALGDATADDVKRAREALEAAQVAARATAGERTASEALRAGLARKHAAALDAATAAREAQAAAELAHIRAQHAEADADYAKAAEELWSAWERAAGWRAVAQARGVTLPGRSDPPQLWAIGPASAAHGQKSRPNEVHGYASVIVPFHDGAARRVVIEAELAALATPTPERPGVLGRIAKRLTTA